MNLHDYLMLHSEQMPQWLNDFKKGDAFDIQKVSISRVVYYPGSAYDGQPIKTFNQSHFAHLYIYVDYGVDENYTKKQFIETGFVGYNSIAMIDLTIKDLTPDGWLNHITLTSKQLAKMKEISTSPFGFINILERKNEFGDDHGAKRFAVLYLGADGIATYDALFGNHILQPHLLVLEDHGFGGNYDKFGRGGLMEKIAKMTGIYPKMILCGKLTNIWDGYSKVDDVESVFGGMHHSERELYKRDD
jgi:hypothetical protein